MHHHELAVLGFHDVELNAVGSGVGGGLKGRKRVLHTTVNEPPVRNHLGLFTGNQSDHGLVVEHRSSSKSDHPEACRQPHNNV